MNSSKLVTNHAKMELERCLKIIPTKSYNKFGWLFLIVFEIFGSIIFLIAKDFDSKTILQCNPYQSFSSDLRKYIETQCLLKYAEKFHHLFPNYALILINFGLVLLLSFIYAWLVKGRVEIFADPPNTTTSVAQDEGQPLLGISQAATDAKTYTELAVSRVLFMVYIMHLIFCRIVPLAVFAILLLTSSNYPVKYDCPWSVSQTMSSGVANFSQRQNTNPFATVDCTYPMGKKKEIIALIVATINFLFVIMAFMELSYLLWSSWKDDNLLFDLEFCCVYILGKRKRIQELMREIRGKISDDVFYLHDDFGEKRLSRRKLEEMYINALILEGREVYSTSRKRFENRHEAYEAHFKLPPNSVTITEAQKLFTPVSGHEPKTILVVGRPGIGKTLLTKKILYQWKKQKRDFWHDKLVMVIRFRDFNKTEGTTSLLGMLEQSYGFNVSSMDCNHIYEYICLVPNKVVLIFDGLDELKVDHKAVTEEIALKSPSKVSHVIQIYRKLVEGKLLPGITVLTTSRPTAEHIYQDLKFDREVELIGFDQERIKDYVEKFCHTDKQKSSQIWNLIQPSPELLGLCYIPVNSYIVCLTLKESIEAEGLTNAPRTISELYKRAINILLFRHHREYKDKPTPKNYITGRLPEQLQNDLNKLKEIAIQGTMENKLIFECDDNDVDVAKLSDCGLFNKLEDKRRNDFCFLHLTIQEFLAALHVVDDMNNVELFLSEHIKNPQWHLVIQFVCGLVGDKMRELEKERNILER